MNRREFIKRSFGLAVSLVIPASSPYFTVDPIGWTGDWKAGETICFKPTFHMSDFGVEIKVPFLSATEDTHIIITENNIDLMCPECGHSPLTITKEDYPNRVRSSCNFCIYEDLF
jgi:hypothetical protein